MTTENRGRIVVGIVGFLSPDDISSFKQHLKMFEKFRLIKFKESHDKIWLTDRLPDRKEGKEGRG